MCHKSCWKHVKLQANGQIIVFATNPESSADCVGSNSTVLAAGSERVIWSSPLPSGATAPFSMVIQTDGNLILCDVDLDNTIWSSHSAESSSKRVIEYKIGKALVASANRNEQCFSCPINSSTLSGAAPSGSTNCTCIVGTSCQALADLAYSELIGLANDAQMSAWGGYTQTTWHMMHFKAKKIAISASCYPGIRSFCQQLVGSTIFTNVRRHRDLDFHFVFNSRVDIYTPSSTIKDGEYRVVEIGILRSGRKYQQKLILNIISQR